MSSVLRKPNTKYDIIPYMSNVNISYIRMAGLGYFRTNRSHMRSRLALDGQDWVTKAILLATGFPVYFIKRLRTFVSKSLQPKKKFLGTTVHDKVSKRHLFVKNVIVVPYSPVDVPGKKLEQYVFTVKKN